MLLLNDVVAGGRLRGYFLASAAAVHSSLFTSHARTLAKGLTALSYAARKLVDRYCHHEKYYAGYDRVIYDVHKQVRHLCDRLVIKLPGDQAGEQVAQRSCEEPDSHHLADKPLRREFRDRT